MLQLGKKTIFIFLLIILAIAAFFRFYKLAEIPPGLYPDVAINANDALLALKTHDFKVFYPENNGREGLFINLIALSFYFFGVSIWAIKFVPAIIGTLTVLGLYLMTRELFSAINQKPETRNQKKYINPNIQDLKAKNYGLKNWRFFRNSGLVIKNLDGTFIALLSSFFLAVSFWHVNFSRLGFRAIMIPFILVWGFYFLFRAIRMTRTLFLPSSDEEGSGEVLISIDNTPPQSSPQLREEGNAPVCYKNIYWILGIGYWILAGLVFGLGFSTYISYRIAPLIVVVVFIIEAYNFCLVPKAERRLKKFILPWFILAVFVIAAASPMLIYFYNNPQDFMGRTGQVSALASPQPIKELTISTAKSLGMFNIWGDCNWRHNYACKPALPLPIGILFLIGILWSIATFWSPAFRRRQNNSELEQSHPKGWTPRQISLFLLVWFFVMLLPEILTNEGLPHSLRSIGAIPVVYIFIGIGGCWTYEKIKNYESKTKYAKKIIMFLLGLFFAWSIAYVYDLYFIRWGQNPEVKGAFAQNLVDIGNYLNNQPKNISKFVIVNENGVLVPFPNGVPMPAQTPMFIEKTKTIELKAIYILPEELNYFNNNNLEINHPIVFVLIKNDEKILEILKTKFPAGEFKDENGVWAFMINPNKN